VTDVGLEPVVAHETEGTAGNLSDAPWESYWRHLALPDIVGKALDRVNNPSLSAYILADCWTPA
jgi:hypothetical protein